jgi:aldose sugar dehydrogenase
MFPFHPPPPANGEPSAATSNARASASGTTPGKGQIFVGALRGNQLQRVAMDAVGLPQRPWESMLTDLKQRIREVRQGPDGLLYLLTNEDAGALLKFEPA